MKTSRITEAEIIDVLMGNADAVLQERVKKAVCTDLRAAELFSRWEKTISSLQSDMQPLRDMGEEINAKVMSCLGEQSVEQPSHISDSFTTPFFLNNIVMSFLGPQSGYRQKRAVVVALCSLVVVAVVALVATTYYDYSVNTFIVNDLKGEAFSIGDGESLESSCIIQGQRLRFPTHLRLSEDARVVLKLPHDTIITVASSADINLESSRYVQQELGSALYRINKTKDGLGDFTVKVPQGTIVDLGTEFEVTVSDEKSSFLRVESGKVRVFPSKGKDEVVTQNEQAIMNTGVVFVEVQPEAKKKEREDTIEKSEYNSETVSINYRPVEKTMASESNLLTLIQPKTIKLTGSKTYSGLRKAPPFTSDIPKMGIIRTIHNDTKVEVLVACDTKLSGKRRIYIDENLNGDLTDDPIYEEGEDFIPERLFPISIAGRSNELWLKCPARRHSSTLEVPADELAYISRIFLDGEVEIPTEKNGLGKTKQHFILLDTDCDGDFGDDEGSLGVWATLNPNNVNYNILAVAPPSQPLTYSHYRWTLSRNLSGDYQLRGDYLVQANPLKVGDSLPVVVSQTLSGEDIRLAPPQEGYLLIYVWSTWHSSCQRDVPSNVNDLYTKFRDRGLTMVGISTDYRKVDMLEYLQANPTGYKQVFDGPDMSVGITAELGIYRSPVIVLVDITGRVVSIGKSSDNIWSFLDANL